MKATLLSLFFVFCAVPAQAAAIDNLRTLILGGAPAGFAPVEFRTEVNPAYVEPERRAPRGLAVKDLQNFMDSVTSADKAAAGKGGQGAFRKRHGDRIVSRLYELDRYYVDDIDAARWRGVLDSMRKETQAALAAGERDFDKIVDRMLVVGVSELKDPFTEYMDKKHFEAFQGEMAGRFFGIGASVSSVSGGLRFDTIYPGSPAERAGLKPGDIARAIDGSQVSAHKDIAESIDRIRGAKGTAVALDIERAGTSLRLNPLRDEIKTKNVMSRMLTPDTGYVYFDSFRDDTDTELFGHIHSLKQQGARKIVLDVRGNGGGRLDTVNSIASEFLRDGQPIVTLKEKGQWVERFLTKGDGMFADLRVILLVNGGSASASEILAGALQDHTASVAVVGSRTYGKGSAQVTLPADERGLKVTVSRWHTPADRSIDAQRDPATGEKVAGTGGVSPDVEVAVSEDAEREILSSIVRELNGAASAARPADPVLEKALQLLTLP